MELSDSNINKFVIFQEMEFSYISGNKNTKKLHVPGKHFSSSKNKKLHLKNISYISGKRKPKKICQIFSKERFSYILKNGNPRKLFLYFRL